MFEYFQKILGFFSFSNHFSLKLIFFVIDLFYYDYQFCLTSILSFRNFLSQLAEKKHQFEKIFVYNSFSRFNSVYAYNSFFRLNLSPKNFVLLM